MADLPKRDLFIATACTVAGIALGIPVAIVMRANQPEPAQVEAAGAVEVNESNEDRKPDWDALQASYLEGCMGSGALSESTCVCMYDGLVKDKGLSVDDMDQMAEGQFTDDQMNVIVSCL